MIRAQRFERSKRLGTFWTEEVILFQWWST